LQVPARINRLIFFDAIILDPGESIAFTSINQPSQSVLAVGGGYPVFPVPLTDKNPLALIGVLAWKILFISDTDNTTLAMDTYSKVRRWADWADVEKAFMF
jgi:hypothetical protein